MADRDRVGDPMWSFTDMQQERRRFSAVVGNGARHGETGSKVRAGCDGQQAFRERHGDMPMHMPRKYPHHMRVPFQDGCQFLPVFQTHAVQKRDSDRRRRVVERNKCGLPAVLRQSAVQPFELPCAHAAGGNPCLPGEFSVSRVKPSNSSE